MNTYFFVVSLAFSLPTRVPSLSVSAQDVEGRAQTRSTPRSGFGGLGGFGSFEGQQHRDARDYKDVEELIKNQKCEEALRVLQSYSTENDIYYCDCNDAPHKHRSPKRKFLIAQCFMGLGKLAEARNELRSFFEIKADPRYVRMGEVLALLINLETATGYADFEAWLNKYLPAPEKRFYRGSAQQVVNIKKDVEAGRYDTGYEELSTMNTSGSYGEPRLQWQQQAALSYFKRNPKSLNYLLQKLATSNQSYPHTGIIYSVGEIAKPEAIPVLRKLKEQVSNYHILNEIVFALAKSGDKAIIPDLYARRGYRPDYINSHLSTLTGTSFGEIKNESDANRIFERWKQWIDGKTVKEQ